MIPKSAIIILGAGYGDEGKGTVTDYFSHFSFDLNPVVIRFNGGHQAGHTVQVDGKKHVFSSFGSGTLRGVPTFWSKYCTFSPLAAYREYQELVRLDLEPVLYLDPLCPVTTPYDVLYNQWLEDNRGPKRHGSVGVGFGTTLERQENTHYRLYVHDLQFPSVVEEKLKGIQAYYQQLLPFALHSSAEGLQDWIEAVRAGFYEIRPAHWVFRKYHNYIFEGAQGILLDMDHGFFPHVTRSNTTSKNAMALLQEHTREVEVAVCYVTRAYQTRHGAGPLHGECSAADLQLVNTAGETNVLDDYQGHFRYAPLNKELLDYALGIDEQYAPTANKSLFISCLDQYKELDIPALAQYLKLGLEDIFVNHSPEASTWLHYPMYQTAVTE